MLDLTGFLAIAVVVIVTPGPDTALTVRNTFLGGRRAGVATGLGCISGQLMWALATGAGVAALLQASRPAFMALRYLGAAYLIYLGIEALRAARRMRPADDKAHPAASAGLPPRRAYRQGVMSNLANPKIAVFFTSLLPQFARGGEFEALVLLGVIFAALTLVWLTAYAFVVAKAAGIFRRGRLQRNLEALAGATLVALGVRVATDS